MAVVVVLFTCSWFLVLTVCLVVTYLVDCLLIWLLGIWFDFVGVWIASICFGSVCFSLALVCVLIEARLFTRVGCVA